MAVGLYTDVHIPMSITRALRRRGYDVLTAQDDLSNRLPDSELLDRSMALGRILFTQDEDFLAEVAERHRSGREYATVVYGHQFEPIGRCIADLEVILEVSTQEDSRNNLLRLPL